LGTLDICCSCLNSLLHRDQPVDLIANFQYNAECQLPDQIQEDLRNATAHELQSFAS
jgi:hypothetical protein